MGANMVKFFILKERLKFYAAKRKLSVSDYLIKRIYHSLLDGEPLKKLETNYHWDYNLESATKKVKKILNFIEKRKKDSINQIKRPYGNDFTKNVVA
jgi:hypothetical protein